MKVCALSTCERLRRLSLSRNSVVRLTDRHYRTQIMLLRHKTPTQTNKYKVGIWSWLRDNFPYFSTKTSCVCLLELPQLFEYPQHMFSRRKMNKCIKLLLKFVFWDVNNGFYCCKIMSHLARKPTKWHVRPAKTQICPVWSESSLSAWRKLRSLATHWAHREDSDQTGRMSRHIWVFTGCTCHSVGFVTRWLLCFYCSTNASPKEKTFWPYNLQLLLFQMPISSNLDGTCLLIFLFYL